MASKKYYYLITLLIFLNYSIYILIFSLDYESRKQEINLIRQKESKRKEILIRIGDRNVTTKVTIVTLMFHVSKSKHSASEYKKWFESMSKSIGQPFVAYVDEYWSERFIQSCNERNLTGYIYIVKSIWEIMLELERNRSRTYLESYLSLQNSIDPEKKIHSPELYAIWNLKFYLLNKISNLNPFNSEYFLYTDCGAWRFGVFSNWPDIEFVKKLGHRLNDRILLGEINPPDPRDFSIYRDYMQAGFFLGSPKAISEFQEEIYRVHDEWLDNGWFIGKEQNALNYLTFLHSKHLVVNLITKHQNCNRKYDPWFFYLFYFAQKSDFICSVDRFSILKF